MYERPNLTYYFDYHIDHTIVTEGLGTPQQRQTLYHFDTDQHYTGMTDGLGNRTTFVLDNYGRIIKHISPMGRIQEYHYTGNVLGQIAQLTGYEPISG